MFRSMVEDILVTLKTDLNSKAYALFGSGVGKAFLQYLESITTNNVHPAGTNIETLAHAEGLGG